MRLKVKRQKKIKKIMWIAIIEFLIVITTINIDRGLERTSEYLYANTSIQSLVNHDDLASIDYVNVMFPSYRRYLPLPNGNVEQNQEPLEYRGPFVISDPFTMLTMYYWTGSEVYMSEKFYITETGYSTGTITELKQLKDSISSNDLNSFIKLVEDHLKKSSFGYTAVLLVITPRTLLWVRSDKVFYTQHYDNNSEVIQGQLNTLVAEFLANERFRLIQKIDPNIFIIQIKV
jgi:hypothetical protein